MELWDTDSEKAKKITLVTRNRPSEKLFITHPLAQSNAYKNIYF